MFPCGSVTLYGVTSTQLLSPCSVGQTLVSSSREMQVPFTAKIPLQMLNRELIRPFHFCYCRVKTIPGRWTSKGRGETVVIQVVSSQPAPSPSKDIKGKGNEERQG